MTKDRKKWTYCEWFTWLLGGTAVVGNLAGAQAQFSDLRNSELSQHYMNTGSFSGVVDSQPFGPNPYPPVSELEENCYGYIIFVLAKKNSDIEQDWTGKLALYPGMLKNIFIIKSIESLEGIMSHSEREALLLSQAFYPEKSSIDEIVRAVKEDLSVMGYKVRQTACVFDPQEKFNYNNSNEAPKEGTAYIVICTGGEKGIFPDYHAFGKFPGGDARLVHRNLDKNGKIILDSVPEGLTPLDLKIGGYPLFDRCVDLFVVYDVETKGRSSSVGHSSSSGNVPSEVSMDKKTR